MADYTQDANCQGYFAMMDSGNELDRGGNTSNTLTETSGTIPTSTDVPSGMKNLSRDFEASETEHFQHADGKSTDISGADQAMSIVCWIKLESLPAWDMCFVSKYDYGNNQRQYLLQSEDTSGKFRFVLSNNGTNFTVCTAATNISTGSWIHLAGVYNDTDMRLYVNGSLDSNGADNPKIYSDGINNSTTPFGVGVVFNNGSAEGHIDGKMKDVAIFDRELSAAEVSEIYASGITGLNGGIDYTKDSECQGAWLMKTDENPLTDSSGEGNTGALKGAGEPDYATDAPSGYDAGSYDFDGTDDYIDPDDVGDFGAVYSVCAWFKSDVDDENNVIASYRTDDQANSNIVAFQLDHNNTDIRFIVRDENGVTMSATKSGVLNTTDWFFVCGVRTDQDNVKLYVNALSVETGTNNLVTSTMNRLIIGGLWDDSTDGIDNNTIFNGKITEVAVFDRVLTESEINDIKDYGLDGTQGTAAYMKLSDYWGA